MNIDTDKLDWFITTELGGTVERVWQPKFGKYVYVELVGDEDDLPNPEEILAALPEGSYIDTVTTKRTTVRGYGKDGKASTLTESGTAVYKFNFPAKKSEDGFVVVGSRDRAGWVEGVLDGKYYVQAKVYDLPSQFGINDGHVSKMVICDGTKWDNSKIVFSYDRGYDVDYVGSAGLVDRVVKALEDRWGFASRVAE